jgi:hypothetical protein
LLSCMLTFLVIAKCVVGLVKSMLKVPAQVHVGGQ